MTKVLAIVSHPDDEILGVGGTLLRHKAAGDEVSAVILYECSARGPEQRDHAVEAMRRLGFVVILPDPDIDLEMTVAAHGTGIVYMHSRADLHHEHQEAVERTLVACRPQSGVRALYAFETPSATDWSGVDFRPQRYVDITDTLEQKLHAMGAYTSELREIPHPRSISALRMRAAYWGQRAGVAYAEPFEVIREVWS